MSKHCKFNPDKRCFHESCDFLDSYGNVRLCSFHPNPSGRFSHRVFKNVCVSRKWYYRVVSK
jgi:hypothetical protein